MHEYTVVFCVNFHVLCGIICISKEGWELNVEHVITESNYYTVILLYSLLCQHDCCVGLLVYVHFNRRLISVFVTNHYWSSAVTSRTECNFMSVVKQFVIQLSLAC